MGETKKDTARGSPSGSRRPPTSRREFEVVSSSHLWGEIAHEQEEEAGPYMSPPCKSFPRARD
eukprot:9341787-Heterocapsa_arctica.AAC.1